MLYCVFGCLVWFYQLDYQIFQWNSAVLLREELLLRDPIVLVLTYFSWVSRPVSFSLVFQNQNTPVARRYISGRPTVRTCRQDGSHSEHFWICLGEWSPCAVRSKLNKCEHAWGGGYGQCLGGDVPLYWGEGAIALLGHPSVNRMTDTHGLKTLPFFNFVGRQQLICMEIIPLRTLTIT